ncbi:MAG: hypothetical protein LC118_04960 [Dehalococcoidia bacterium]|nr:hypothetical protein [Dehalococcoidia bacterium]
MTDRFRFALLPAMLMLVLGLGLFAAACSGDDDNSGGSGDRGDSAASTTGAGSTAKPGSTTKSEKTARPNNGGATGSDEEFVSGMCKAAQTFVTKLMGDMDKVTPSATAESLDDLGKFFEAFFVNLAPAFEQFARDFKNLKPPKDLKEWHANAVTQMDAAVKALKSGKFDDPSIEGLGDNMFPEMPKAIKDRLEKIAKNNPDCKELDEFSDDGSSIFGSLGPGLATATP